MDTPGVAPPQGLTRPDYTEGLEELLDVLDWCAARAGLTDEETAAAISALAWSCCGRIRAVLADRRPAVAAPLSRPGGRPGLPGFPVSSMLAA